MLQLFCAGNGLTGLKQWYVDCMHELWWNLGALNCHLVVLICISTSCIMIMQHCFHVNFAFHSAGSNQIILLESCKSNWFGSMPDRSLRILPWLNGSGAYASGPYGPENIDNLKIVVQEHYLNAYCFRSMFTLNMVVEHVWLRVFLQMVNAQIWSWTKPKKGCLTCTTILKCNFKISGNQGQQLSF